MPAGASEQLAFLNLYSVFTRDFNLSSTFRENTPVALRRHAQQNTTFDLKQYLKDKFAALIDNFEGQVVPSERPDRKYFFARRIGPYKQQGQTGKLKNLDLNCSVR